MKNNRLVVTILAIVVALSCLVSCAPDRSAKKAGFVPVTVSTREFIFTYKGNVSVNGLHVEFNVPVDNLSNEPFPNVASLDVEETTYEYYGISINVGNTATVKVKSHPARDELRVKKWWWLKDEQRIGAEHEENPQ